MNRLCGAHNQLSDVYEIAENFVKQKQRLHVNQMYEISQTKDLPFIIISRIGEIFFSAYRNSQ